MTKKPVCIVSESIQEIGIDLSRKKSISDLENDVLAFSHKLEALEEQMYLYGFVNEGIVLFDALQAVEKFIEAISE